MDTDFLLVSEGVAEGPSSATVPLKPPRKKIKVNREEILGTLFAAIPLIGFMIFAFVPLILAVVMAFLNVPGWDIGGATLADKGGFGNFITVLTDPLFWDSVVNTLILGTSTLISQFFALFIAYFLSKDIKGRGVLRIIYFMPYVCSVVAVTLMWQYMFNTNYGIINQMLGKTGDNAIDWLGSSDYFSLAVIIMSVWSGMGYGILLYSAALTNVNQSLVEAARIDGAGAVRVFWNVILPTISPTSLYLLIMGVIGALQSFSVTQILASGGGPNNDGVTIVFYMYQRIFNGRNTMGVASAAACVLAVMILFVTMLQFLGSRRWVKYDN